MLDEASLLIARINDIVDSAYQKDRAFTHFLSESELAVALPIVVKSGLYYSTFGGYDQSDRRVVGISLSGCPQEDSFPITTLYFKTNQKKNIGHRDVLGALLALGIKRSLVGDIFFSDGFCYFFVESNISDFVINNFDSVADLSVKVQKFDGKIQYKREFEQMVCIVMSMRLDCIVSAVASCSRAEAEMKISSGTVFVNSMSVKKKDFILKFGDILSVRRLGKYKLDYAAGATKKGRIKLNILKYT